MDKNNKNYDLEERTYKFAKDCRNYFNKLSKTTANIEYGKQLVRSSSSTAANYIEANESLSRKDYFHRTKICRKESKESRLWLRLIDSQDSQVLLNEQKRLITESLELCRIFGSILKNNE